MTKIEVLSELWRLERAPSVFSHDAGGELKKCATCGNYMVLLGSRAQRVYCSRACKERLRMQKREAERKRQRREMNRTRYIDCAWCKVTFLKGKARRFCSPDCRLAADAHRRRAERSKKPEKYAVCHVCGHMFTTRRCNQIRCSPACTKEWKRRVTREWYGRNRDRAKANTRRARGGMRARLRNAKMEQRENKTISKALLEHFEILQQ